jgi:cysteine desulfurase
VILAMREVENLYANPSGIYRRGVEAKNKIEVSRKIISSILNCNNSEIIFTGSGTESINLALLGYVKNYLAASVASSVVPKVITSNVEHSAVLETLLHLEKENLIEIIFLKVDETGRVKENDLREILKESGVENNIILVSVMYANNETGRVQPVKEIGRIIDEYNRAASKARSETQNQKIAFHIDAMQAGNYLDIDVKKLRCDMLSMNGSKIYGPKGIGLLYKNKDIKLSPIIYGGGQEGGIRSGTEDVQKIVGLACAMQIAKEKRDSEIIRILELQNYFLENIQKEFLKDNLEVKIYTEKNDINKIVNKKEKLKINYFNIESLPNNINIGLPNMLSDEMVIRLDYAGFDVSHKSACASNETGEGSYVLRAMGATEKESNENIRITMGRDTKLKDLQKLIQEIKNIYEKYKS